MLNLTSCSKCNQNIIRGGIDNYSGELVCADCVSQCKIKIRRNCCAFLKQLSNLHLDELNTISLPESQIIDSIHFLELFLMFHVEGFNKIQSMDMVHKLINNSISL